MAMSKPQVGAFTTVRPDATHESVPRRVPLHRRVPLRWLVVLVTGVALFGLVYAVLRDTGNPLYLPSLLLLGAAVVPMTFITLIRELQVSSRISLAQVILGVVLGGVIGTVLAGQLEYEAARNLGSLPNPLVGLIEESSKLAVVAAMLVGRKARGVDGLILGVAVGSGFAALETMGYGFVTLLLAKGNLAPVTDILMLRAVSAPGGHVAWTGLAAAALFSAPHARRRWWGWVRFLLVFAGVIALHAAWDATASGHRYLWVAALSFLLLLAVTWQLHRAQSGAASSAATPVDAHQHHQRDTSQPHAQLATGVADTHPTERHAQGEQVSTRRQG
jgi:RsiW-degrading membrane proteinase PrsW (M82 family)